MLESSSKRQIKKHRTNENHNFFDNEVDITNNNILIRNMILNKYKQSRVMWDYPHYFYYFYVNISYIYSLYNEKEFKRIQKIVQSRFGSLTCSS